jgi:hypothetical protein
MKILDGQHSRFGRKRGKVANELRVPSGEKRVSFEQNSRNYDRRESSITRPMKYEPSNASRKKMSFEILARGPRFREQKWKE